MTKSKAPNTDVQKLGEVTVELFDVIFKFLDSRRPKPDDDNITRIETTEHKMKLALNALGNVVVGLVCSSPDSEEQLEWFFTNTLKNCEDNRGHPTLQ